MMAGTVIFVSITYLIMLISVYLSRYRRFHITVMASIMVVDFMFPFYLYMTRDWIKRLIDEGEIFSFLIWMHVILLITLYILYVFQVTAGRRVLQGDEEARSEHRGQAKGILIVKALVIMTGALLVEPESTPQ